MAKFYGKIGYGTTVNKGMGVAEDVIVEYYARGDVIRNSRELKEGESVNNDISISNSISIVMDAYARANFFAIRYIEWMGALWTVTSVEQQGPRLLMRLGGVYNGPRATP
jgi:hypothetical protein